MTTENKDNKRLQELRHSGWEISEGEPDITGWDVKLASGEEIGEVDDLIFDTESRKVRYLKVDLDGKVLDSESRDVLVPIGLAQLQNLSHNVVLNNVTLEQLRALPEYDEDELNPEFENRVRQSFSDTYMTSNTPGSDADFYSHEHFNDNNFYNTDSDTSGITTESYDNTRTGSEDTIEVIKENLEVGKRQVQTGGIRVKSRIIETPVEETINLREESVNIDRVPVDRMATGAAFVEREIEMREHAEVPVVQKDARVIEEIVISKDVEEREETIRDTVKETEVNIENLTETERRSAGNTGRINTGNDTDDLTT